MVKIILTAVCLITFTDVYSQEISWKNAVFAEFLGNGGLYSVNYEYQTQNKMVVRTGIAIYPEVVTTPIIIGKLIGSSNDLLELGFGTTLFMYNEEGVDNVGTAIFLTGVIGYRYQRPDNRFIFRIGFTPLISINDAAEEDFDKIIPLGGMSFGFRF